MITHYHFQCHFRFHQLCYLVTRMKVILRDLLITLEILNRRVFGVKHSPYQILPDIVCAKVVDKDDEFNDQSTIVQIAWQMFLAPGEDEGALKSIHSPLTCLTKGPVNITDFEDVVPHIAVQAPCCPFCDRCIPCASTLQGESLNDANFVRLIFCLR